MRVQELRNTGLARRLQLGPHGNGRSRIVAGPGGQFHTHEVRLGLAGAAVGQGDRQFRRQCRTHQYHRILVVGRRGHQPRLGGQHDGHAFRRVIGNRMGGLVTENVRQLGVRQVQRLH